MFPKTTGRWLFHCQPASTPGKMTTANLVECPTPSGMALLAYITYTVARFRAVLMAPHSGPTAHCTPVHSRTSPPRGKAEH